jgi:hypothetical protein
MGNSLNYTKFERFQQHSVEFKLYEELENPTWEVRKSLIKKLFKIWKRLDTYEGGIPVIPDRPYKGCIIRKENYDFWFCFDGCVIMRNGNIFEMRKDEDSEFENEVLRSTPSDIYKFISCYIQ